MRTPTSFSHTQGTPHIQHSNHQHHPQSPAHQGAENVAQNGGTIPGMANSLAAVQSNVSPTLPHLPPMPQASQAHPDGRINNMMVQRFDTSSANTTEEAEAAAVLASGMVSHGVMGYDVNQLHHQQQQHDNPYAAQHLPDHGHGIHTDPLAGNGMPMMGQMQAAGFYDPAMLTEMPDDGFQGELQYFTQGPGLQAGATWVPGVFGF